MQWPVKLAHAVAMQWPVKLYTMQSTKFVQPTSALLFYTLVRSHYRKIEVTKD